ncbi:MAG TPA: tRNA pseudouridine(55) synthase TruB [Planctomycetaceae bacterium]|nr:tRNA pseudouridine(55) synthase TruB [Planctomycetaceae bacterium]
MTQPPFGLLNVHKPAGLSSRKVVDRVARIVRPAKAGHAGTLDPLATGVLIVCVGRATRLIAFVQELPKAYRARFVLGRTSPTDDVSGEITEHPGAADVARAEIEALLPQFTGRIAQVPPQFSAVHVAGQRAYQRARRGETVELAPRTVVVHRLSLAAFEPPEFELDIECGSGTYVRSIGRDIGARLGCGAVMQSLVRTRVGPYRLDEAVPLDDLDARPLDDMLLPAVSAVGLLPAYHAAAADLDAIRHGRRLAVPDAEQFEDGANVAVIAPDGELACVAVFDASRPALAPSHVFVAG